MLGEQAGDAEIQVSQQEQEARPQEDGQGRGQGRCFLTGSQAPVNLTNCRAQGQRQARRIQPGWGSTPKNHHLKMKNVDG